MEITIQYQHAYLPIPLASRSRRDSQEDLGVPGVLQPIRFV